MTFATNAPGYGPLQSPDVLAKLNQSFFEPGGCQDQELACYAASAADAAGENGPGNSTLSDKVCRTADHFCVSFVFVSFMIWSLLSDMNYSHPFCDGAHRLIMYSFRQWEIETATTCVRILRRCFPPSFILIS